MAECVRRDKDTLCADLRLVIGHARRTGDQGFGEDSPGECRGHEQHPGLRCHHRPARPLVKVFPRRVQWRSHADSFSPVSTTSLALPIAITTM